MVLYLRKNIKFLMITGVAAGFFSLLVNFKVLADDSINNRTQDLMLTSVTDSSSKQEAINDGNIIYKNEVPVNKRWKIKFSQPIKRESIKDSIKIIDKNSKKEFKYYTYFDKYDSTIEVVPLDSNYNPDSEYLMTIDKNVTSKYDKKLTQSTTLDFKTASVITSIDDINVTIKQEEEYTLPSTIDANMSNGTIKTFKVIWDKPLSITSIPGSYTYYGTVEGYDKAVVLNLTITPFEPVSSISNSIRNQSPLQVELYNYMMNYDNRESVMERAVELHGGDLSNNCVYFASEALRRVGLEIPSQVDNTTTLTSKLKSFGWKTDRDLSRLLPGDVCFTTDSGYGPTHTYIFMRWVKEDYHEYAYICDNQGDEYGNNSYHKRNINFATAEKEAISYFMYIP